MDNALDQLLRTPGIWRAGAPPRSGADHLPTGFPELDAALAGGGWPLGALSEILHDRAGIGELRLLMPALARLSRGGRWIALIAPPYIPYAPALASYGVDLSRLLLVHPRDGTDALWAVEQALRSRTCGAVLAWPARVDDRSLRRLQLAAEEGGGLGLLFRAGADAAGASPAALRLRLEQTAEGTMARLLKCRGGMSRQDVQLDLERLARPCRTAAGDRRAAARPQPDAGAGSASRSVSRQEAPVRRTQGSRRRAAQIELPLPSASRPPLCHATSTWEPEDEMPRCGRRSRRAG